MRLVQLSVEADTRALCDIDISCRHRARVAPLNYTLGVSILMDATKQQDVCARYGSSYEPPEPSQKVGIARSSLGSLPLNALRHLPKEGVCGWYIWGGEQLSENLDFFEPLHVAHLSQYCPEFLPFLALAPGYRVLLAPGYEDVWYDDTLLLR